MTRVAFWLPGWADADRLTWASDLLAIERYASAAVSCGLQASEIADDINARWAFLGPANVKLTAGVVWIELWDDEDASSLF